MEGILGKDCGVDLHRRKHRFRRLSVVALRRRLAPPLETVLIGELDHHRAIGIPRAAGNDEGMFGLELDDFGGSRSMGARRAREPGSQRYGRRSIGVADSRVKSSERTESGHHAVGHALRRVAAFEQSDDGRPGRGAANRGYQGGKVGRLQGEPAQGISQHAVVTR